MSQLAVYGISWIDTVTSYTIDRTVLLYYCSIHKLFRYFRLLIIPIKIFIQSFTLQILWRHVFFNQPDRHFSYSAPFETWFSLLANLITITSIVSPNLRMAINCWWTVLGPVLSCDWAWHLVRLRAETSDQQHSHSSLWHWFNHDRLKIMQNPISNFLVWSKPWHSARVTL